MSNKNFPLITALSSYVKQDFVKGAYHSGISSRQARLISASIVGCSESNPVLSIDDLTCRKSGMTEFEMGVEIGILLERDIISVGDYNGLYPTAFAPHSISNHGANECYLYAITDGVNTKIGITKSLSGRLRSLQTGSPKKLHVHCAILTKRSRALECERWLHNAYKSIRLSGEWFGFRPDNHLAKTFQDFVYASQGNRDTELFKELYE